MCKMKIINQWHVLCDTNEKKKMNRKKRHIKQQQKVCTETPVDNKDHKIEE